ncbi:MAG: hypothetical protein H7210_09835 [Pyrinomonadaceae bacterium]|nr:hypothetical protein [Phycisphaerales bacterium]
MRRLSRKNPHAISPDPSYAHTGRNSQKAAELLQQAAGNASQPPQPPEQEEQKEGEQQQAQEAQEAQEEKQPKSDMTAARILDKERREAAQKALRSLRLRGRAAPVEKDW